MSTWAAATIVAPVAGVVGFFVVLRGSAFPAHAIPKGAFAGAAGASLLGVSTLAGLAVFSLLGALGIGALGRRTRHDVATVPVVGALLIFSLMIGPPAAARSVTSRPLAAMALSAAVALVTMWAAIAASCLCNWPVGFFVGTLAALSYGAGRAWAARRRARADRPAPPVVTAAAGRT